QRPVVVPVAVRGDDRPERAAVAEEREDGGRVVRGVDEELLARARGEQVDVVVHRGDGDAVESYVAEVHGPILPGTSHRSRPGHHCGTTVHSSAVSASVNRGSRSIRASQPRRVAGSSGPGTPGWQKSSLVPSGSPESRRSMASTKRS